MFWPYPMGAGVGDPTILILAAGRSARMRGADKLLLLVDGVAQLRRITLAALETGCPVLVALAPEQTARHAAIHDLPVRVVVVSDPDEGMAASIRAGVRALPQAGPAMIVPADMPALGEADLLALIAAQDAQPGKILRGAALGRPGHPVIFPTDLVGALQMLSGDEGARGLIACHAHRVQLVPLPAQNATLDLDTPEEWAEWLRNREAESRGKQ